MLRVCMRDQGSDKRKRRQLASEERSLDHAVHKRDDVSNSASFGALLCLHIPPSGRRQMCQRFDLVVVDFVDPSNLGG